MSVLSVLQEDNSVEPARALVACAKWVALTCDPQFHAGAEITFELQEVDAGLLKPRLGSREQYSIDEGPLFWAELTSLQNCPLSAEVFCFMGGPRLRGALTVGLAPNALTYGDILDERAGHLPAAISSRVKERTHKV